MPEKSYRNYLHEEFKKRQTRNSAYSLRAFARDIGLSATHLSDTLRGKGDLSIETASSIAEKISLTGPHRETFLDLVTAEAGPSEIDKEAARKRLQARFLSFKNLSPDEFFPVSEWYYMPLLELFSTKLESHEHEHLAARLGLTLETLNQAIENLLIHGLLQRDGDHYVVNEHTASSSEIPSFVIRRYHSQMFDQAKTAIAEHDLSQRHVSSITFSMSKEKLAWAQERISQFRRELALELTSHQEKDAVYTMSICLFENTKDLQ